MFCSAPPVSSPRSLVLTARCLPAVTPLCSTQGIFHNARNASASEAFVSVVHNTKVNYFRFPVDAFKFNALSAEQLREGGSSAFSISIGDSTFTDRSVTLSIMPDSNDDATDSVMGEITFEHLTPWTTRGIHPSTMGFTGLLPHGHMSCNHHVLSMHHALHGYISVGEQLTDLEMGTGYTEKDWGAQFPSTWVWAQSNHFAMLKPPKRGNKPGGIEGEVWAEENENTEETAVDGPGRGESSGAVSALYADHVLNHHNPVSLFLSIARVDLTPGINRLANALGLVSSAAQAHFAESAVEPNSTVQAHSGIAGASLGFIAGFLYEGRLHIFSTYQLDQLTRFEIEEDSRSGDLREVLHLSFTDARRSNKLDVSLHKPVAINAGLRRRKDTQCLKKLVAQKNRERERLVEKAGKLNPLEEAFLMDSVNKARAENEGTAPAASAAAAAAGEAEMSAAEKAAIEAGIAAARAENPAAKLAALESKPVPAPAPIIAGLYGPHHTGRMEKFVKESLIGGRVEIAWSRLKSSEEYAALSVKQRREGQDWRAEIVGSEILYVQPVYRAIGKPAAMELMGDLSWLEHEAEHQKAMWSASTRKLIVWWMYEPFAGLIVAAGIAVLILLTLVCTGRRKAAVAVAPVAGAKSKTS